MTGRAAAQQVNFSSQSGGSKEHAASRDSASGENFVRTVAITGATSGIGAACVESFILAGHKVIAIGRRTDRLSRLAEKYDAKRLATLTGDVQDKNAISQMFESLPPEFSEIDTLVNNAGLLVGESNYSDLDDESINRMVQTNCMGVVNMSSVLLKHLQASGRGHIVNVTSIGASHPYVGGNIYAATKAFVEHFGACLRAELVSKRIRLTTIRPGRTETEFSLVRFNGDEARAANAYRDITPLQANDIACAISWAVDQPLHVNINSIELMPADQNFSFR